MTITSSDLKLLGFTFNPSASIRKGAWTKELRHSCIIDVFFDGTKCHAYFADIDAGIDEVRYRNYAYSYEGNRYLSRYKCLGFELTSLLDLHLFIQGVLVGSPTKKNEF